MRLPVSLERIANDAARDPGLAPRWLWRRLCDTRAAAPRARGASSVPPSLQSHRVPAEQFIGEGAACILRIYNRRAVLALRLAWRWRGVNHDGISGRRHDEPDV